MWTLLPTPWTGRPERGEDRPAAQVLPLDSGGDVLPTGPADFTVPQGEGGAARTSGWPPTYPHYSPSPCKTVTEPSLPPLTWAPSSVPQRPPWLAGLQLEDRWPVGWGKHFPRPSRLILAVPQLGGERRRTRRRVQPGAADARTLLRTTRYGSGVAWRTHGPRCQELSTVIKTPVP